MWISVVIILIMTFELVEEVKSVVNYQQQTSQHAYLGDYFSAYEYEESSGYQFYVQDLLREQLRSYLKTGEFNQIQSENSDRYQMNVEGTITHKTGKKKKQKVDKIKQGDNITQDAKDKEVGILDVMIHIDREFISDDEDDGDAEYICDMYATPMNKSLSAHAIIEEEYYATSLVNQEDWKVTLDQIDQMELYVQIPEKVYQKNMHQWETQVGMFGSSVERGTAYIAILLVALIALSIAVSPKNRTKFGAWVDRWWLEVLLCIFGLSVLGALLCAAAEISFELDSISDYITNWLYCGMLVCELVIIYMYISIVRRMKERKFIKSSLCYKICHKLKVGICKYRDEWNYWRDKQASTLSQREKAMHRKRISIFVVMIAAVLLTCFTLVFFFPLGIIVGGLMIVFCKQLFQDYKRDIQDLLDLEKVLQQVYEISNGNLRATTDISESSLYYKATNDLAKIGTGMEKSVEEQLKGERMKIDLITNVSHDLKTPLTSIISYIDLLSKDETLSAESRDYVLILGKKADRLKNIVIDLFDLAKSTSGNAKVEYSILDMKKLVEQTMIEMEDKIQKSGFEIIVDYQTEQAHFEGDANRMYRVVQNILENALKYSLMGSRIFISVIDDQNKWKLAVKNTASYRMEFTEEEILERFTRGDKSRTTEGNGLGLSIADSFTRICGGELHVRIDGDQFTVEILFPKYKMKTINNK